MRHHSHRGEQRFRPKTNGAYRQRGEPSSRGILTAQVSIADAVGTAAGPEHELPDYVVQGTAEYHAERARQTFKKPASKVGRTIRRLPDDGQPTDPEQLSNAELDRIVESLDNKQGREAVIVKLAAMSPLEYDQQRTAAAKVLGVRASTLDASVKAKRADGVADTTALPHWDVSAWPEPVDGAQLLDGLAGMFRRYVVLPVYAPDALALWIMHAWAFEAWEISPFIVLVSPEKRCGKTTVLIILQFLAPKTELASNISNAAMFRYIEDERPTLLIDEADSFLKDNEEMRGVLNSGHTKTAAYVIRTVEVNGEHKAMRFSTWAPKAIASIGSLQDTLEDRAIMVAMTRKAPGDHVERLRRRDNPEFAPLRRKAKRWADDHTKALAALDPSVPKTLNDRAADNWRPLIAIGDLVGGEWSKRAREAAKALSGDGAVEDRSIRIQLLADIRPLLQDPMVKRLTADTIIAELIKDTNRPWADWKNGRPITPKALAALLKPFKIHSQQLRIPETGMQFRGYLREPFDMAFNAFLGSIQGLNASHPSQTQSNQEVKPDLQCVTDPSLLHIAKVEENAAAAGVVTLVTDCEGETGSDTQLEGVEQHNDGLDVEGFEDGRGYFDR